MYCYSSSKYIYREQLHIQPCANSSTLAHVVILLTMAKIGVDWPSKFVEIEPQRSYVLLLGKKGHRWESIPEPLTPTLALAKWQVLCSGSAHLTRGQVIGLRAAEHPRNQEEVTWETSNLGFWRVLQDVVGGYEKQLQQAGGEMVNGSGYQQLCI